LRLAKLERAENLSLRFKALACRLGRDFFGVFLAINKQQPTLLQGI